MATLCSQQSSFRYKPLDDISSNIRLLRILPNKSDQSIICTLEQATSNQPYTCLSYCWGPDKDHHTILVNEEIFLVRPNLHAFLALANEYSFDQPIWIDAICINQADTEEKSKQVQMMGQIYSSAIRTIVWLGLSQSDCQYISTISQFANRPAEDWELEAWEAAFGESTRSMKSDPSSQIIQDWKEGYHSARAKLVLTALHDGSSGNPIWGVSLAEQHELWSSLLKQWCRQLNINGFVRRLASSEYWKRTWIIQELVLSKNAVFFCEVDNASVKSLLALIVNLVYTMRDGIHQDSDEWKELLNIQNTIFSIARELTGTLPITSTKTHFAMATRLTAGRLCTDIRDRIFAIVSLIKNGDKFVIDYNQSLDELLVRSLRFHIADRGSDLIITRVLPTLFQNTADTLELRPPASTTLPPLQTLLDEIKDFDSAKNRFFWARAPVRSQMEFPLSANQDCSLCIEIDICGHRGILEFWCQSDMRSCYKDLFWWTIVDGRWMGRVAGNDVDDVIIR